MSLTDTQRTTLRLFCDTIVPRIDRDPDPHGFFARTATEIGVDQGVEQLIDGLDDELKTGLAQLLDALAEQGIAYVPFFPLGGFSPLQSATLSEVADGLSVTAMQVALAWLLQRAPNILLIPGTSSVAHLGENVAAASLVLPADAVAALDRIAGA